MNNSVLFPIDTRSELNRFHTYKPGLAMDQIKRQYGLKSVIKLASNESALGPSPKAVKAYKKALELLHRYPESRSTDLRGALAQRFKIDIGEVIVGAGSDEIIELLAKAYLTPQDNIVVSAAAFMQYRIAAALMGAGVITVPMKDMKHDLEGMAAAVNDKTKFAFIVNPNNPTGTYSSIREVEKFLKALPAHVVPVFDEAYFEYASMQSDYPSMLADYFRKRPMVVLRTFSKIYGLAGLRVGFGIAPENCVVELDKIRPPFNVSIPAQAAAVAALEDVSHVKKSVALNEKERAYITDQLHAYGIETVPTITNFVLLRTAPTMKGRLVFEELLQKGVIARSVDEYGLPDYLRVSVGVRKENDLFLKALREVVRK